MRTGHIEGRRWVTASVALVALGLAGATGCTGTVSLTGGDGLSDPPPMRMVDPISPGQEFECDPSAATPAPLLRRLTRAEYLAAVERLTGVDLTVPAQGVLPLDDATETGFSNFASALTVQNMDAQAHMTLAATAVASLVDSSGFIDRYTDCREESCFAGYIDAFVLDAFGSPASLEEQEAFAGLYGRAVERGDGFDEAALDALEAGLQSPRFLYHFEPDLGDGSARELEPLELARRISFMVIGEAADETLIAAAMSGGLMSDEGITEQIDRLLNDAKARESAHTYIDDWLNLGALQRLPVDAEHHPTWVPELGPAMRAETLGTFDEVVWERDQPFTGIFDADFTVVSPELATFYGLSAPDSRGLVDLTDVHERGGLLTHGGVLALSGGPEASTVTRGLAFSAQMSCGAKIPEPPATVNTEQPPPAPGRGKRDFSEERVMNPVCTGCHSSFEPLVWGLIRYDAVGLYAEEDEAGNFIPEDGYITFVDGTTVAYESPTELGEAMATSERVTECMMLNVSAYSIGRALERGDSCSLKQMREGFLASDRSYRDLLVQVAISPLFRTIGTEPAPAGGGS